jgi:hypothetical protein
MALIAESELSTIWVDDVPESPVRFEFIDEFGNPVNISDWDHFRARLYSPALLAVRTITGSGHGNHIDVTFAAPSFAEESGIYSIVFQFWNEEDEPVSAVPFQFVVEERDGWLSIYDARALWPDAPTDDVYLFQLLESAKTQCATYAPTLGLEDVVPVNYRQAQLMQVRAVYMSFISNQNDSVGVDGYQVRTFPLDWNIKALLRPKAGKPVLG